MISLAATFAALSVSLEPSILKFATYICSDTTSIKSINFLKRTSNSSTIMKRVDPPIIVEETYNKPIDTVWSAITKP
ncbi:MAG: hypothetical protein ACTSXD_01075, partial [Candidatus Heimdallarchaeaceae archaeon]